LAIQGSVSRGFAAKIDGGGIAGKEEEEHGAMILQVHAEAVTASICGDDRPICAHSPIGSPIALWGLCLWPDQDIGVQHNQTETHGAVTFGVRRSSRDA
jgi:hypothetical protein